MALNLYRRHGSKCPGGRALHETTYEADEFRRGWRNCACPIYASGTLGGKFKRRNTERTAWPEAKAVAAHWELAAAWVVPTRSPGACGVAAEMAASAREPLEQGMPLADAIQSYLAVKQGTGMAESTLRKYRTFTNQLTAFADGKGYTALRQFTASDIDMYYANWKLGPRSKAHGLEKLRGFFRFCVNREWIGKSPVTEDLKPPLGASRVANKVPFTDEELRRIVKACDRLETTEWSNGAAGGIWTGQDVKDFVWVLLYTGLRISDAALFDLSRLHGNELLLRAKKNGGDVFTWIPDWLRDRLRDLQLQRGSKPFIPGVSIRLETVTDLWRRRINRVFALAGRFDERPTPHRFRHTFARILLQRGVPVSDVADLLGDDENTVRKHYARWVPERQARLTSILRNAFGGGELSAPELVNSVQ